MTVEEQIKYWSETPHNLYELLSLSPKHYSEQALKNFPEGGPGGTLPAGNWVATLKIMIMVQFSKGHFGNTLKLVSNGSFSSCSISISTQNLFNYHLEGTYVSGGLNFPLSLPLCVVCRGCPTIIRTGQKSPY